MNKRNIIVKDILISIDSNFSDHKFKHHNLSHDLYSDLSNISSDLSSDINPNPSSISEISFNKHNISRSVSPIRNHGIHCCSYNQLYPNPKIKHISTDNMCRGEKKCYKILINIEGITDISYKYRINGDNMKSYDFYFVYDNKKYLLEWDGSSHFINDNCHNIRKNIHDQRFRDIMYTNTALLKGYRIIRIDYTQIDCIKYHIDLALKTGQRYYFSDEVLYEYIILAITKR